MLHALPFRHIFNNTNFYSNYFFRQTIISHLLYLCICMFKLSDINIYTNFFRFNLIITAPQYRQEDALLWGCGWMVIKDISSQRVNNYFIVPLLYNTLWTSITHVLMMLQGNILLTISLKMIQVNWALGYQYACR